MTAFRSVLRLRPAGLPDSRAAAPLAPGEVLAPPPASAPGSLRAMGPLDPGAREAIGLQPFEASVPLGAEGSKAPAQVYEGMILRASDGSARRVVREGARFLTVPAPEAEGPEEAVPMVEWEAPSPVAGARRPGARFPHAVFWSGAALGATVAALWGWARARSASPAAQSAPAR